MSAIAGSSSTTHDMNLKNRDPLHLRKSSCSSLVILIKVLFLTSASGLLSDEDILLTYGPTALV